ncbi:MAG: hypothetical protein TR69_WS6001000885 [candidate division WS6 bacterium OLB20]|uniref:Uncharacterized protein n=1 Tax=candidate division WS6 bacterium OLB20 TaxID=1617426 RepID=A0A136LYW4_9BACT|nr:MAG: hypothetical protein TR69_WS6001000885 [candidate division WS6 bacterium OLB20]
MEAHSSPHNQVPEAKRPRQSVPMHVVGGNSSLEDADVVFVGTDNHYDKGYQRAIANTLGILPQAGDVVLTEGEPFGGGMSGSWVPEMAEVDTSTVTLSGWENAGLYRQAAGLVDRMSQDIGMYNAAVSLGLGSIAAPFIAGLKRRIEQHERDFDSVVLNERSRAMKRSVMSVLGNRLKDGGTAFVYAGSAHLTRSQLSGMGRVRHVVLGV